MLKHFKVLLFILSFCLFKTGYTQTTSGILGKKWLISYENHYKFGNGNLSSDAPIRTRMIHNLKTERISDQKYNIGISISYSFSNLAFNNLKNKLPYVFNAIGPNIQFQGKDYISFHLHNAQCEIRTKGIEFYVKKYIGFHKIKNYGWYLNYKFGLLYYEMNFVNNPNISFSILGTQNEYKTQIPPNIKSTNKLPYVSIELGKTIPLENPRFCINTGLSFNLFIFDNPRNKLNIEFSDYIGHQVNNHIARRQQFVLNIGCSYAL